MDADAVLALARADDRTRAVLTAAWEVGVDVSIPAVVLAETLRVGGPDTPVNRVVKAVGEVRAADERAGRLAGGLLGEAGSDSTVDALVVACAVVAGPAVILTGDPEDLRALAGDRPEIRVQPL